jgi:prepilin-type N-terminal cleavage/methylation domain-containing protein
MHRLSRKDDGFTLIELLLAIVVLGVITVPLANIVVGFLGNTDTTTGRLVESQGAQISAAYFAQDVASIGTRNNNDPLNPVLKQSVETGVAYNAGLYPCGVVGTPNAIVRFAWDDVAAGPGGASATTTRVVAYYVGNGTQLHRLNCRPVTDGVLNGTTTLTSATAAFTAADVGACVTGSGIPAGTTIAMFTNSTTAALSAAASATATGVTVQICKPYQVTLTGQRRQT